MSMLGTLLDLARRAWRAIRPIAHRLIGPLAKMALSLVSRFRRKKPSEQAPSTSTTAPDGPPSTASARTTASAPSSPPSTSTASSVPSSPGARTAPSTANLAIRSSLAAAPTGETAPLGLRWQRLARRLAAHLDTTAPA